VLIGDQVSAIRILSLLSPVADIALHTLWSAMGQQKTPGDESPSHRQYVSVKNRRKGY
jgi:hypothetical protein